jgi:hypothetical protein
MKTKKKKRKMRPGGGAKKGGSYERKLARSLSAWWYGDPGYLWRRPGSGHRVNMPHRHTGDIVPMSDLPAPDRWPFHVEAKCYAKKRLKLDMALWPKRNPIGRIWRKAVAEKRKGLVPLLILKANNTDPVAVMRPKDVCHLLYCLELELNHDLALHIENYTMIGDKLIIFPWNEILKHQRPGLRNYEEKFIVEKKKKAA